MTDLRYPITVRPLSKKDGGGYLATVIDLPGCISDGETPEEAIANILSAIDEWSDEARRLGREVPLPGSFGKKSREHREQIFKLIEDQEEALKAKDELLDAQRSLLDSLRLEIDSLKDEELDATCVRIGAVSVYRWGNGQVATPSSADDCLVSDLSRPH